MQVVCWGWFRHERVSQRARKRGVSPSSLLVIEESAKQKKKKIMACISFPIEKIFWRKMQENTGTKYTNHL
jgi:hypothetical protein